MAPKFGTSGLRGLVVDLTSDLVADYLRAFLTACPVGSGLYVGRDLRPSSPALASHVIAAARGEGINVTDCGAVPTPSLALVAMQAGAGAVMVTGSHIPADRNGLKFYLPRGEISKADEAAIIAALGRTSRRRNAALSYCSDCSALWSERYVAAFGTQGLAKLKIGVWSHSAVSRDAVQKTLELLGAEVVELGRSDTFIPVDTEAVPAWARAQIATWVAEHQLDALVSTDGDGDRPLVADAAGTIVPGDLLGQITARVVGAHTVVTPISSNTGVATPGRFARVVSTRIGSPFVIDAMAEARGRVVGYEANGGFLLGFDARLPAGPLAALPTRDSLLPIVAPLSVARAAGGLAALVAAEPPRFTAADRLEDVATERATAFLQKLISDAAYRATLLNGIAEQETATDQTDGLRITCASGNIVHLRPSGNAPEFRVYVEAADRADATRLMAKVFQSIKAYLVA
jgi:phosphomannomutase